MSACFAIKPLMQFVFNPLAGAYVDKRGPHFPLFISQVILAVSTFILALAVAVDAPPEVAYTLITSARAVQGFASSLVNAAAVTLVVQTHSTGSWHCNWNRDVGHRCRRSRRSASWGVLSSISNYVPFAAVGSIIALNVVLQVKWHRSEIFASRESGGNARESACRWRCIGSNLLRDFRVSSLCVACLIANGLVGMAEPFFLSIFKISILGSVKRTSASSLVHRRSATFSLHLSGGTSRILLPGDNRNGDGLPSLVVSSFLRFPWSHSTSILRGTLSLVVLWVSASAWRWWTLLRWP